MSDLLDYEIFVRVINAGSLSAAARQLNASTAMISKRLTRMEKRLGARLLQRTTRRLTATDVGQRFYEQLTAVLAAVEDAESLVTDGSALAQGLLRVSAPTSFGRMHIAPRLRMFMDSNPGLQLDINLTDDYVDLVAAGFDLAVRIGTLVDSSLVARRLAPNRRVLCATPEYLHNHGEPTDLADLAVHRLVAAGQQTFWRLEGPEGPITYKPRSVIQSNSSEVVREAVLSGVGIGFRSTWDVGSELKNGQLKRVLPEYGGASDIGIYAMYPSRHHVPVKVRAFVDYLAQCFGPEPYWDLEIASSLPLRNGTGPRLVSAPMSS